MTDVSQAFSLFMDSQKMQAIFQQELPECLSGGWQLTGCEIQHPRYKTYVNPNSRHKSFLAAAYHLTGINQPAQQPQDGIVYVKAYLGDRSQAEYATACATFQDDPQHAPMLIERYGMVTWFFPHDPALPALSIVMDARKMQDYFADILFAGKPGFNCGIKEVAVQVINYRPELRCTYRYDLTLRSGAKKVLYGKTFADEKGIETYRRVILLKQFGKHKADFFALPNPVAYDVSLNTLWTEGVQGKPLIEAINKANSHQLMMQIAQHLAAFHQSGLEGLEIISEDELLAEIEKKSAKLQSAFPAVAKRIDALVVHLSQQKERLPLVPNCLVHGDFHIQQLMRLADRRIALFDYDELALANPLVDVANFSADLVTLDLGEELTHSMIHRLVDGYKLFSGNALSNAHFDWYFRVQLMTRAYRAYIQQKTDCRTIVEQFLRLAECGYKN